VQLLWRTRRRKVLIDWPQAVDDRLERLVRAATAAGENVSRSQMLAALVATADPSPQSAAQTLRSYRLLDADAMAEDPDGEALLPQLRHRGPRRTTG